MGMTAALWEVGALLRHVEVVFCIVRLDLVG